MKTENVLVSNRSASAVGYTSYQGQPRYFQPAGRPGDTLPLPAEEIKQLSYTKGGRILLEKYLYIQDANVVDETIGEQEPEYDLQAGDIEQLLKSGSADELTEVLEFAPEGVLDLVKAKAVELRLDSTAKRKLIQEKTGFNVNQAIKNAQDIEGEAGAEAAKPATRNRQRRQPKKEA